MLQPEHAQAVTDEFGRVAERIAELQPEHAQAVTLVNATSVMG